MNSHHFYLMTILAFVTVFTLASCSDETFTPPEIDEGQDTAACSLPPNTDYCPAEPEVTFENGCSPFLGTTDEPEVEVVAFANFSCPHCAMFAAMVKDIFSRRSDLKQKVRIYFHHFPFNVESDWSIHAAAHAARLQGDEMFWAIHDEIYGQIANGKYIDTADVVKFARDELKLDMTRFDKDRKSDATMSFLAWDRDQAMSIGVGGTPSVFVCGESIDWRTLEYVLDGLLGTPSASD